MRDINALDSRVVRAHCRGVDRRDKGSEKGGFPSSVEKNTGGTEKKENRGQVRGVGDQLILSAGKMQRRLTEAAKVGN